MKYAPNYTDRIKVYYNAAGRRHSHTLHIRPGLGGAESAWYTSTANFYADVWGGVTDYLYSDFQVIEALYAVAGSNIFLPLDLNTVLTGLSGTGPAWTGTGAQKRIQDMHFTFSGKCRDGVKVNLKFYGIDQESGTLFNTDFDGVAQVVEHPAVAPIRAALQVLRSDVGGISGAEIATWYRRATSKRNDYWLRQTRKSS